MPNQTNLDPFVPEVLENPYKVLAELMGLPEEDIPRVKRWCDARIERMGGTMISHERELARVRLAVEFQHCLFHQIERVEKLLPAIRERAAEAEGLGRVPSLRTNFH